MRLPDDRAESPAPVDLHRYQPAILKRVHVRRQTRRSVHRVGLVVDPDESHLHIRHPTSVSRRPRAAVNPRIPPAGAPGNTCRFPSHPYCGKARRVDDLGALEHTNTNMTGTSWRTGRRAPATEDEWRDCVAELTPFLLAVVRKFAHQTTDADDLVQGVWLKAWRRSSGYTGTSTFGSWLYRVAANHCISAWRDAQRPKHRAGDRLGDDTALDVLPGPVAFDDLAMLRALPAEARLVAEGYSGREAADRIGICYETFKTRLFRWRLRDGAACYDRLVGTVGR